MDPSGQALSNSNEINNEDIISNLPESVLSHILSFLPMEDAVRTSILSTEWKFMWTSIYNLEFNDKLLSSNGSEAKKKMFINFIERVLLHCGNSEIRKCTFDCFEEYEQSLVDKWISTVLRQKVQKLSLRFGDDCIVLPFCLFNRPSLQELRLLMSCILRVPTNSMFSNLKIMYLEHVELMNESYSHSSELSLTFPVLEHFTVLCCIWSSVAVINIEAPHLSTFEMTWSSYGNDDEEVERCMIKIFGACLSTFKYAGSLDENFVLPSPSTISEANINYFHAPNDGTQTGHQAAMLLGQFSALKSLELAIDIVEALHRAEATASIPVFDKLTTLKLFTCNPRSNEALMSFISKVPNLRVINIGVIRFFEDDDSDDARIVSAPPQCVTCSLEEVSVVYHGTSLGLHLMEFLLKNASVLQVVRIIAAVKIPENLRTQIRMQLLAFPKASSNAIVEIMFLP